MFNLGWYVKELLSLSFSLFQSFDQDKKGRFRLDDFISLCIFLQSARYVGEIIWAATYSRLYFLLLYFKEEYIVFPFLLIERGNIYCLNEL